MRNSSIKITAVFSSLFYNIFFVVAGSFLVQLIVSIITLAYFKPDFIFDISKVDLIKLYSMDMLPNLITYAIFLMVIYYFFHKTRKMVQAINENEIRIEKERSVVETSQQLTGLIVQSISHCNNEIKEWVVRRKMAGKAPEDVERASNRISLILQAFSQTSFLHPYIIERKDSISNIEDLRSRVECILEDNSEECFISNVQEEEKEVLYF